MKGIIVNLLEAYLVAELGEAGYESLLQDCPGLASDPTLVVAPGNYPDDDFLRLCGCAAQALGLEDDAFQRAFGRYTLGALARRYPDFFAPFRHPREFLKFTGMVHHVEIKKLYQDAQVPHFSCQEEANGVLRLGYRSRRRLCHFVEGLIQGLADHYGVTITSRQERCMARGDDCCEFLLTFAPAAS